MFILNLKQDNVGIKKHKTGKCLYKIWNSTTLSKTETGQCLYKA
jgi:hypothetical protein